MNIDKNSRIHQSIINEYRLMDIAREEKINSIRKYNSDRVPEIGVIDEQIACLAVHYAKKVLTDGITPENAVELMEQKKAELIKRKLNLIEINNLTRDDTVEYNCNMCNDTGFILDNPCSCYIDKLRKITAEQVKKTAGLGVDFKNNTFSDLNMSYYSREIDPKYGISPYENMSAIHKECGYFVKNFYDADTKNLLFYGASGLGKTYLSHCIANELISKGVTVVYQTAYKLFQFLEDYKFGKISREDNEKIYNSIYDADLLIVDDLGTEFITSYTCSVFFDVMNTRLMEGKKMIISTNLSIGELENIYSQRVFSRILGNYNILQFFGEDIRRINSNK